MSIKKILVPVDGSEASLSIIDTALVVAKRFDAHIEALHVLPRAQDSMPFMFDRLSPKLRSSVAAESDRAAQDFAAEARKKFEEYCTQHGIVLAEKPGEAQGPSASWIQDSGRVGEVLVKHARLSDVVAVARPGEKASTVRRSPAGENLEGVMLGAGRPVLIVPPQWQARRVERIAIGWNESLEASRALAMTMPWIPHMSEVSVLVSKKREPGVGALVEYLGWHGVNPKIRLLDGKGDSVGEAMLNVCDEAGAEFLVVGGFSRARARQLMFGGVTRHLLSHANILTVMVH